MKKPMSSLPSLLTRLLIGSLLTAITVSCGDDNLGQAFQPKERNDLVDYGPPSPLVPGMKQWYHLITAYKRTAASNEQGLTQHEVQGSGHLCIAIDKVNDIHTEAFNDEPETILEGRVKISGQSGDTQMFVSDQDDPNASPAAVDSLLGNLWLKRLIGPSANHGYETPKKSVFKTQAAPIPNNFEQGLSILPFFEIRQLPEQNWSGWTSVGGELEGASNLTNNILRYFQDAPFFPEFMADSSRFRTKITTPPASCSDHTDPASCAMKDCTWATPLNSQINSCMRLLRIGFAWRDTIRAPEVQAGNVLHFIEFMYYDNGMLYKATEDIRPDNLNNSERLSANFPEATCNMNCQSADLSIKGGFADDPAYPAPCSF